MRGLEMVARSILCRNEIPARGPREGLAAFVALLYSTNNSATESETKRGPKQDGKEDEDDPNKEAANVVRTSWC